MRREYGLIDPKCRGKGRPVRAKRQHSVWLKQKKRSRKSVWKHSSSVDCAEFQKPTLWWTTGDHRRFLNSAKVDFKHSFRRQWGCNETHVVLLRSFQDWSTNSPSGWALAPKSTRLTSGNCFIWGRTPPWCPALLSRCGHICRTCPVPEFSLSEVSWSLCFHCTTAQLLLMPHLHPSLLSCWSWAHPTIICSLTNSISVLGSRPAIERWAGEESVRQDSNS